MVILLLVSILVAVGHSLATYSPTKLPFPGQFEPNGNIILLNENTLIGGHSVLLNAEEAEVTAACENAERKYPDLPSGLCLDLAEFECSLKHNNCYGDSGRAYGMHQWWQSSWDAYNKKFGTNLSRASAFDQAEMSARVILIGDTFNWKRFFNSYTMVMSKI